MRMEELSPGEFTLTTDGQEADWLKVCWDALDLDVVAVADLDLTRAAQPIDGATWGYHYLRDDVDLKDAWDTEQLADLAKKTYIWDDDDQNSDHWRPQTGRTAPRASITTRTPAGSGA